jgi:hypothetical protein
VRKGFELIATGGYSADDALRTVTALGLTTRKLRPVPRQTWHSIIRNPIYAGWVRSGELLVQGVHESIVPQELFDNVQEYLQDGQKPHSRAEPFILNSLCGNSCAVPGAVKV